MKHITVELEEKLRARILDLEDKERWMRNPKNPDGFAASILIGRCQGQIGEIKYIMQMAGCK